ncbi:MAG: NADH-quinone oxidoreductase subunit C [Candidatus Obscuribacterales bacterium]
MTEHTPAKPAEEPKELPPGPYGTFLKEHGIASTRLADHLGVSGNVECIEIDKTDLEAAVKRLRNSQETDFNYLVCVAGVDSDTTYDAVYHLWSYNHNKEVVLKVRLPKSDLTADKLPHVASLTPFWPAANWHERETYDLVGIRFIGHPYMRRILNPWDWEGYPLRKEYKQPIDALNDKNPHSMR